RPRPLLGNHGRQLLRSGCARLGWIEGRNLAIEYRWAEARSERFAEIAAEFVRLKVDVIVSGGNAAVAAKQASTVVSGSRPGSREGLDCSPKGDRPVADCAAARGL